MIVNKNHFVETLWELYIDLTEYSIYTSTDPAIHSC